jgi:hypothetical protein
MKDRNLLVVGCSTVSASGESLACPVNAVSDVCPAHCDDRELFSTAYISGDTHGHCHGAECISESIALVSSLLTRLINPLFHSLSVENPLKRATFGLHHRVQRPRKWSWGAARE